MTKMLNAHHAKFVLDVVKMDLDILFQETKLMDIHLVIVQFVEKDFVVNAKVTK